MISEPWQGPDRHLRLTAVLDRASRLKHHLAELGIGDVDASPYGSSQFIPADGTITSLYEIEDAVERTSWQLDAHACATQFARRYGEFEVSEAIQVNTHNLSDEAVFQAPLSGHLPKQHGPPRTRLG